MQWQRFLYTTAVDREHSGYLPSYQLWIIPLFYPQFGRFLLFPKRYPQTYPQFSDNYPQLCFQFFRKYPQHHREFFHRYLLPATPHFLVFLIDSRSYSSYSILKNFYRMPFKIGIRHSNSTISTTLNNNDTKFFFSIISANLLSFRAFHPPDVRILRRRCLQIDNKLFPKC